MVSLHNVVMHVIETSANGVVNQDTRFVFQQRDTQVYAEYAGGKIARGYLVGNRENDALTFVYCQIQHDGTIDSGRSQAQLEIRNGRLRLIEHFEWASRPDKRGMNIFEAI